MSGKELAAKLRDRGFSHIRSHMTALDEFEVLQVQAVLEAHGIIRKSESEEGLEALGGGLIKRKKKKIAGSDSATATEATVETTEAPPPEAVVPAVPSSGSVTEPIAEAAEAPVAESAPPEVPVESPAPPVESPAPPTPVEEVVIGAPDEVTAEVAPEAAPEATPEVEIPSVEITSPPPAVEAVHAEAAEAVQSEEGTGETGTVPEVEIPTPTIVPEASIEAPAEEEAAPPAEPVEEPAPAADEVAEPEEPAVEVAAKAVEKTEEPETEEKKQRGPAGKVVGFIDLSKIQTTPQKSDSRRLRSRDDVLPDVRPTLRHDSRRSMLRGDRGSRDSLTAAQLREREAGRYRRHQRGAGGRGSDRGRGRSGPPTDGSPYVGQTIKIEVPITVKKLAEAMSIKANQLLQVAFRELGFGKVTITSAIDEDTAELLADEFDVKLDFIREIEAEEALIDGLRAKREAVDDTELAERNPVVAFLGHVDHGKTTLIDYIRSSRVAAGEHGGITQHIGAYRVTTELGHHVTIIDTPGHAAFTSMRVRGAQAVDVVVLVVAADAGVQPQTEEALNHARAAKVPIVVAMNKIDRPEANPQRALEQLSALDLIPEEWGGPTAVMKVSGITGEGIQELLERIFLESEMLELTCLSDGPASGIVLEAEVQQGKGIVAHLLIQDGTLNRGNVILAGEGYGKVRSIHDDFGAVIENAGPSVPVEVTGLSALPGIGEPFHVVDKLDEAKKVAEERARKSRAASMAERRKLDNTALLQSVAGPKVEEVNLIIRGDVQGSVEVLRSSLSEHIHDEVETRILQAGVGAVTENDVLLASTSSGLVIAFNVAIGAQARQAAERENVEIRSFNVLYEVIDHVHDMMEGRLAPEVSEEVTAHVEIRRLFKSSKIGVIAGCYVLDGTIVRDHRIRLLRDDRVIHSGALGSLRREADDAREVREGFECGIVLRNYNDIREGDIIEAYKVIETKRTLKDSARS